MMLSVKNSLPENIHWYELDLLRGLAAIFMIVNHVGYAILAPELTTQGLSGILIFVGSFAPVLFFFITGVGYGLQSRQQPKESYWSGVGYKVFILLVADQFFYWNEGTLLGLNFLGFIGFSTLVIAWIRRYRHSVIFAFAGFFLVSSLRYLIAPIVQSFDINIELVTWILGQPDIQGISYPMSPWLAYPFAGYLIGYAAARYVPFKEKYGKELIVSLFILSCLPAILAFILLQSGSSFHRWGTVAIGFYAISFSIIIICLVYSLACVILIKSTDFKNIVSLRGISSLAVVPIHYYLIFLIQSIGLTNLGTFSFLFLMLGTIAVSFFLSKSISLFGKNIQKLKSKTVVRGILISMVSIAGIITFSYASTNPLLSMSSRTYGQILLCLLFVISR